MRIVVALGGNALLRRGEPAEAETQRARVREAAAALAGVAAEHELVVTHGNGPQVGLLALEAAAYPDVAPYPLDILGAESQGMVGYLLVQAIGNELPARPVVALLTQVRVDPDDAAFARPTKPIGPVYAEREAQRLAAERGWTVAADGARLRRVVASPEPREIVELASIERLLESGAVVVCAGGGGIPVAGDGELRGVEAVVDKDLTSALLAQRLDADLLVMLTDVSHVERDWGTARATPIRSATPAGLRRLDFAAGSMGPKVEAACRFVEAGGAEAAIGSLAELDGIVRRGAGTRVVPSQVSDARARVPGRHTSERSAMTTREADGGRRLLVATGAAVADVSTLPPLVHGLLEAASDILVVTPVMPGRLQWWASDTDRAIYQADARLDAVLGQMEQLGLPAEGQVGDETPLTALDDAVRSFGPDHILIALRGGQEAGWQERGLVDRVRERFGLPLTVFVVDEA